MEKSKITLMPFYTLDKLSRLARRATYYCHKPVPVELFQKIDSAIDNFSKLLIELSDYEKSQKD